MTERLKLTPMATATIESETADELVVRVDYAVNPQRPPVHLHPEQEERFEVLAGVLYTDLGKGEHVVREGQTLTVPPGTPHTVWTPEAPTTARWTTTPPLRTAAFFRALDEVWQEARLERLPVVLAEFSDVFVLSGR